MVGGSRAVYFGDGGADLGLFILGWWGGSRLVFLGDSGADLGLFFGGMVGRI